MPLSEIKPMQLFRLQLNSYLDENELRKSIWERLENIILLNNLTDIANFESSFSFIMHYWF